MPDHKAQMLTLREIVDRMPLEQQDRIKDCCNSIKAIVQEYGQEGIIALALVGVMTSVREEIKDGKETERNRKGSSTKG